MKKTLIIKLGADITNYRSAAQLEAYKAFMRATFEGSGLTVDFEVVEENEESTAQRLLRQVRGEFKECDAPSEPITEPAASEEQPMQTVELDESQSKVLRGFFAGSDEPG